MKKTCILCDFDGTVSKKDALYYFFKTYCIDGWQDVEKLWVEKKISSKECLEKEFNLVPDLNQSLTDNYLKTVEIDETFKEFYEFCKKNEIDICIVSDGIDYFIKKILENYEIKNIKIISNHGEFKNDKFELSYPNEKSTCINNLGTCKCSILNNMKNLYEKVFFVGDGISDFCVAKKADILFAKKSLSDFCKQNNITFSEYNSFSDIKNYFFNMGLFK